MPRAKSFEHIPGFAINVLTALLPRTLLICWLEGIIPALLGPVGA